MKEPIESFVLLQQSLTQESAKNDQEEEDDNSSELSVFIDSDADEERLEIGHDDVDEGSQNSSFSILSEDENLSEIKTPIKLTKKNTEQVVSKPVSIPDVPVLKKKEETS